MHRQILLSLFVTSLWGGGSGADCEPPGGSLVRASCRETDARAIDLWNAPPTSALAQALKLERLCYIQEGIRPTEVWLTPTHEVWVRLENAWRFSSMNDNVHLCVAGAWHDGRSACIEVRPPAIADDMHHDAPYRSGWMHLGTITGDATSITTAIVIAEGSGASQVVFGAGASRIELSLCGTIPALPALGDSLVHDGTFVAVDLEKATPAAPGHGGFGDGQLWSGRVLYTWPDAVVSGDVVIVDGKAGRVVSRFRVTRVQDSDLDDSLWRSIHGRGDASVFAVQEVAQLKSPALRAFVRWHRDLK